MATDNSAIISASPFTTVSHIHPSLIFTTKGEAFQSKGFIRNTTLSPKRTNGPNKLVCYIRPESLVLVKRSSLLDPFVSYKENEVL